MGNQIRPYQLTDKALQLLGGEPAIPARGATAAVHRIDSRADVGPLIRHFRRQQGLTQVDLADAVGTRTSTNLCSIEHGRRMPDTGTLIALLAVLGYRLAVVPVSMTSEEIAALIEETR